ncbi:unnamed protein product, partial [Vitis vinifera]|uniref:Uncharacterized protein n=1 Tax=Vitis vinifera TaxID=29760 RepID=D7SPP1_VITVI
MGRKTFFFKEHGGLHHIPLSAGQQRLLVLAKWCQCQFHCRISYPLMSHILLGLLYGNLCIH